MTRHAAVGYVWALLCLYAPAAEQTLYVAPDGKDEWSGKLAEPNQNRTDGPLASLHAARDSLRKAGAGEKRIVLRGGEYFLDKPLLLRAEDSGLTIEAAAGEEPVLHGGRRIAGWQRSGHRFWSAELPKGTDDFQFLVVNNRFCKPAQDLDEAEPAQWYRDRAAGKIFYCPRPDETPGKAVVVAPALETLIRIEGEENKSAGNSKIIGLTLSTTKAPLDLDELDPQKIEGAVTAEFAHFSCTGMTIRNVGGHGVKATNTGYTMDSLQECDIHDTGACGVALIGGAGAVSGCHVSHVGRLSNRAPAILVDGMTMLVQWSRIHDTPFEAIDARRNANLISSNEIHRALLEHQDGGAIHLTSGSGATVGENYIHDIPETNGPGGAAFYVDGHQSVSVLRNVVENVRWLIRSHEEHGLYMGNIFVSDGDALISLDNEPRTILLSGNTIVSSGSITIESPAAIYKADGNVMFSATGKYSGVPEDVSRENPKLVRVKNGYKIADDAPHPRWKGVRPLLPNDGIPPWRRANP